MCSKLYCLQLVSFIHSEYENFILLTELNILMNNKRIEKFLMSSSSGIIKVKLLAALLNIAIKL
jgi:hypothetical protein